MTVFRTGQSQCAALLLAALALALPRLLVPPGFMPGTDHEGRWQLVFCDPALRAALGGHVHSHGHDHASGETCPFALSGGPAFLPVAVAAALPVETVAQLIARPTAHAIQDIRSDYAHGARAPPRV
jgi:hypothetical protein